MPLELDLRSDYSPAKLGTLSAKYLLRNVLAIERIMGAAIKAIRPETLKPGTNSDANQKHKPLITKENAPRLRMFKGKDKSESVGLTLELNKPITNPAIIAAGKLARLTPGKIISTTKRLRAVAKTVKNAPNIFIFSYYYVRQNVNILHRLLLLLIFSYFVYLLRLTKDILFSR